MKKVVIAFVVLLLFAVGVLIGLQPSVLSGLGPALGGFTGGSDKAVLRDKAHRFLEALQYKEFDEAAEFHSYEDEKKADIPKLIQRLFGIRHEQLRIEGIEVTGVTIDSSGDLARTFFRARGEVLNSAKNDEEDNEEKRIEGILYWKKLPASADDPPPASPAEGVEAPEPAPAASPGASGQEEPEEWFLKLESSLH